jgi:hypothetical protein
VALEVRIEGAARLHRLAAQIRTEGRKDLSREMGRALSKAAEPISESVSKEAEKVMPNSGGYRELLTGSLKHKLSRRLAGQQARVVITTYADGTKERRDVVALNKGNLRHPVFGRSRKIKTGNRAGTLLANPWAVTKIRSGFHDRGTANAMDQAQAALMEVVDDFTARLIK